ncbi:hypothetical protein B0H14DRAFT_2598498 [Mycena olivaceomarginata]|nr:hypothetical protein B0H14DRAFT_2598498 [Mycena olivaceomarginata]
MVKFLAVPNARCSSTVGHYYLDLVEEHGVFVQATVDGGSETGELYATHVALRQHCMPDISADDATPFVALKSTDNIPIESSWHLFTNYVGLDIKQILLLGKSHNYFNSAYELHIDLFNWLWPKIIQLTLDNFLDYWNNHKIRTQRNKLLPSGFSPNYILAAPQPFIDALRQNIPKTRKECSRWVPDEFDAKASEVYAQIGEPKSKCQKRTLTIPRSTSEFDVSLNNASQPGVRIYFFLCRAANETRGLKISLRLCSNSGLPSVPPIHLRSVRLQHRIFRYSFGRPHDVSISRSYVHLNQPACSPMVHAIICRLRAGITRKSYKRNHASNGPGWKKDTYVDKVGESFGQNSYSELPVECGARRREGLRASSAGVQTNLWMVSAWRWGTYQHNVFLRKHVRVVTVSVVCDRQHIRDLKGCTGVLERDASAQKGQAATTKAAQERRGTAMRDAEDDGGHEGEGESEDEDERDSNGN